MTTEMELMRDHITRTDGSIIKARKAGTRFWTDLDDSLALTEKFQHEGTTYRVLGVAYGDVYYAIHDTEIVNQSP